MIWEQGRNLSQLPGLPPVHKEDRKYGKNMGKLSLSAAHYLTQAGLSLPAGAYTVLQTTEQKTANPQMRKQVGFLLPNKALSAESFLYWLKPVAEIKNQNKQKNQPLGGMLSALLVTPAVLAVQRQPVCWRHIGLLGTIRSAGDTSVCWGHTASPCSQGTPATHAAGSSDKHTAIQLRPDICAVLTCLPRGSEEKHSQTSYFYSSPLSYLRNCCPIH